MRFAGRGLFWLLLVGACGGTSVADVLGGGSGVAANGVDAGSGLDATAGDAAGADGAAIKDGGGSETSSPEAAPPKEAGARPSDLSCPPTTNAACNMDSEKCCRMSATNVYTCISAASPCLGVEIRCANAADCDYRFPGNGEVCCAQLDTSSHVSNVLCKAVADCHPDMGRIVICDPNDKDACPYGGECVQSTESLPKFFFCKP